VISARVVQGFANAMTQPSSQSIILIHYADRITKAMSVMETSGAIGAAFGPFFGSSLNYCFGYEGPFIVFAVIYMITCFILAKNIPSEDETEKKYEETQKEYLVPGRKYYSLGTKQFHCSNFLFDDTSVGYDDCGLYDFDFNKQNHADYGSIDNDIKKEPYYLPVAGLDSEHDHSETPSFDVVQLQKETSTTEGVSGRVMFSTIGTNMDLTFDDKRYDCEFDDVGLQENASYLAP